MGSTNSITDPAKSKDENSTTSETIGNKFLSPPIELGDFELGTEIGRGGMGIVYLAKEKGLDRKVALKVLPPCDRVSPVHVKRFLAEARAAAQLSHDHIVPVYQVNEVSGTHFFAMKLIEGFDLACILRKARKSVDSLRHNEDESFSEETLFVDPSIQTDRDTSTPDTTIDLSTQSFISSLNSRGSKSACRLAKSVAIVGECVAEAPCP